MKTLYLDCSMGAAGDMLTGALLELIPQSDDFLKKINGAGIPNVKVTTEKTKKCGICGTHVTVKINGQEEHQNDVHEHQHHHSSLADIEVLINSLNIENRIKKHISEVYRLIAKAESEVHGIKVTDIHFHEIGKMDALADITAVCMLMDELSPEKVIVSPIHVGSGQVKCAHGILPVPAPATALILKNVPIYTGSINGELCTPTGAALLSHFASKFGEMPPIKTSVIGYGMGSKDFDAANCVRAFIGETDDESNKVDELICAIDDMTPENMSFATEIILNSGALDVYTIPVLMKKSRQGFQLNVLCKCEDTEKMAALIFKYTTTIGLRIRTCERRTLHREIREIPTRYGDIRQKFSYGFGVEKNKFEYDDIANAAKKNDLTTEDVIKNIQKDTNK